MFYDMIVGNQGRVMFCVLVMTVIAGCSLASDSKGPSPPAALNTSHAQELQRVESYTTRLTVTINPVNDAPVTRTTVYRVNRSQRRELLVRQDWDGTTTVYATPSVEYRRVNSTDGQPQLTAAPTRGTNTAMVNRTQAAGVVFLNQTALATFTKTGTTTVDGTPVTVYESTARAAAPVGAAQVTAATGIRDVSATLYVTSTGLVKQQNYTFTYKAGVRTATVTLSHRIQARNTTTVDRPVWSTQVIPATAPTVNWTSSYVPGRAVVTVRHVGGDAVNFEWVRVETAAGEERSVSVGENRVTRGDSFIIRNVTHKETLRIVWDPPTRNATVIGTIRPD